jgi:hypothetical protein
MHCLREVVWVSARIHLAAKFSIDDIRWRAPQAAWEAAVEYDWVVTDVERERARGFLRAYADKWIAEALSGAPDAITKPLVDLTKAETAPSPLPDSPLSMFEGLVQRHGVDEDVQGVDRLLRPAHGVTRSTLFAWKATEEGKPVSKPLSRENRARITEAVRRLFNAD